MTTTKQRPELSAAERVLQAQLERCAEPAAPVTWQELQAKRQSTTIAKRKIWSLWLTPFAVAAAVAWLWVLQPQQMLTPVTNPTPMLLASNYSLDALDRQIQQAYLQGADEKRIQQLWQQRERITGQETH